MEEKKKLPRLALVTTMLLLLWLMMISPAAPTACSTDQRGCKDCIVDQMKYGCPACVPLLRCMARCLWGGNPRSKCINRCDCNGGKPRLSDCKRCMGRCKCSCVA